jgi:hypothetical protein
VAAVSKRLLTRRAARIGARLCVAHPTSVGVEEARDHAVGAGSLLGSVALRRTAKAGRGRSASSRYSALNA